MTACTEEKTDGLPLLLSQWNTTSIIPFLTKQNKYIYVDKSTLKPRSNQQFRSASPYTSTGFAVVENEKNESAIIDGNGKIVVDFSQHEIRLHTINGLTLYKKQSEYEKKMPFWQWEWNILGGAIKKEQTYRKIEIGVLETKQVLLQKDLPYLDESYYLNFTPVDENHVFWNGTLYKIKKNRFHKMEGNIVELLENKRMLKTSNGSFSMYGIHQNKALLHGLKGSETLSITFKGTNLVLHEINKERYEPQVPKLLVDSKNNNVYPFPQYEKAFPKEITKATSTQIDFIKKTSLVYSITNSPYFLLGVFNYDSDVWAFDWRYIDTLGQVEDHIDLYNFKVLDQVGNLVWPDRKMIFPDHYNVEGWKFGKIAGYEGMNDRFLIPIENKEQQRTMGLWNSKNHTWEIAPAYHKILLLDSEKDIYALQKENDGLYTLYDNKHKRDIGSTGYQSINSDGLVSCKLDAQHTIYYYIDISSGLEYREK